VDNSKGEAVSLDGAGVVVKISLDVEGEVVKEELLPHPPTNNNNQRRPELPLYQV